MHQRLIDRWSTMKFIAAIHVQWPAMAFFRKIGTASTCKCLTAFRQMALWLVNTLIFPSFGRQLNAAMHLQRIVVLSGVRPPAAALTTASDHCIACHCNVIAICTLKFTAVAGNLTTVSVSSRNWTHWTLVSRSCQIKVKSAELHWSILHTVGTAVVTYRGKEARF